MILSMDFEYGVENVEDDQSMSLSSCSCHTYPWTQACPCIHTHTLNHNTHTHLHQVKEIEQEEAQQGDQAVEEVQNDENVPHNADVQSKTRSGSAATTPTNVRDEVCGV